ncbi:purine and uridine phosphorylase [Trichoderma velutinum]
MSNPLDYSVGWICATMTESVAAQMFLENHHEEPQITSLHDSNSYTLGMIGEHNVVIAILPDGGYGTASAVGVARDMLHSFPNVRIGLMVGVGGGAPSPTADIRLGDVVVSAPRGEHGGVFQYDFRKNMQDEGFKFTGFLNQPPDILRMAMSGLKADYETNGHQLGAKISEALKGKRKSVLRKYSQPDSSTDKLYRADIIHPLNNDESCAEACGKDSSNLVSRLERNKDEDSPAIHYGLIASANQQLRDAIIRDKLAAEQGVLCFEMEAAGLMNHFPCVVIRGICNYSDTHKNDLWQGYAAMAAAAYAKDLLCRIPLNHVEAQRRD